MSKVLEARPNDRRYLTLIGILSVVVPVVVAVLIYMPKSGGNVTGVVAFLPTLNAILNSATAALLMVGYVFIRRENIRMHRTMMVSAFALSSLFLVSYIVYHFNAESVKFGDLSGDGALSAEELAAVGATRTVYLVILLTHIVLAAMIVPLVLLSIYFGLTDQRQRHRRVAKWTFPIWLYVAVTGVVVYFMINPYYPH